MYHTSIIGESLHTASRKLNLYVHRVQGPLFYLTHVLLAADIYAGTLLGSSVSQCCGRLVHWEHEKFHDIDVLRAGRCPNDLFCDVPRRYYEGIIKMV